MASLPFKDIAKVHPNGFVAVEGFNLDIAGKESVIFIGPSGCGESTTSRMIAGLEDISSDGLYIDGKLMSDVEPESRGIAMALQNYALYPHMSVYDGMAFGLKLGETPKDETSKLAQEAARALDLTHLLGRRPKALSDGQRQRVAMGRAIVRNPKVFSMDGPLSDLGARPRGQMRVETPELHQRLEATIIYITHDQTEAMTLDTRIVVMKDDIVQQVDPPQNLYDKPYSKFAAGFIGAPQTNLVDVTVGKDNNDVTLTFGGHTVAIPAKKGRKLEDGEYIDKVATLGIRPENLHDEEAFLTSSPRNAIDATIRVYELLGTEVYLYSDVNRANFTARVDLRITAGVSDAVELDLDLSRIRVFDKEIEKVVLN